MSPGGVDFTSGAFTADFDDLSIGGSDQSGLRFARSYNSSVAPEHSTIAGFAAQGWSHNWAMRISIAQVPAPPAPLPDPNCPYENPELCGDQVNEFYHSVIMANRSIKFRNGNTGTMTGNNVGIYTPIDDAGKGTSLVFVGNHQAGHFEFTDRDGTFYRFNSIASGTNSQIDQIVHPDGTIIQMNYAGSRLKMIQSSRGLAILLEYGTTPGGAASIAKACTINLSVQFANSSSACPAGAPVVTYTYTQSPLVYHNGSYLVGVLAASTNTTQATTSYQYDDGGHVSCVKEPGNSSCRILNTFSTCNQDPNYAGGSPGARYPGLHLMEHVVSQQLATGEVLTYSAPASSICPTPGKIGYTSDGNGTYWFQNAAGARTYVVIDYNKPVRETDPLGRVTSISNASPSDYVIGSAGQTLNITQPAGQIVEYQYDSRGNVTYSIFKSSTNASNHIVTHADFPVSCTSAFICNKPVSIVDGRNAMTSFTYASAHGGILTEVGPAIGGVSPRKKYAYIQRKAWIRNSTGGLVQSTTPVWLLSEMRTCRSTNLNLATGACDGGTNDLILTQYDYGPDSGAVGNNLLLRGVSVTADSQTRRTCYGYDVIGNRISETKPRAGLGTCP